MATLKILIADKFESVGLRALDNLGCEVTCRPELTPDELPAALAEAGPDVLIVRSTKVSRAALEASPHLQLVLRAGAGYDTIDVAAASADGVFVANCPGKNAIAVAELAWALILSCDRRVPDQTVELRNGRWNKREFSTARGLYGRTLGVLGLGTIGTEVAKRGLAFGMDVLAWSPSLTAERAKALGVRQAQSALAVARKADVLTVHVASNEATRHLVGNAIVDALKPGAVVINTSRGAVLDEAALRRGIAAKRLRAGLDVFATEPGGGPAPFDNDIATLPGVYGTHHVGASTEQAQNAIAMEAVRVVEQFLTAGTVANCVNLARRSAAKCLLTVRHHNQPGVLATVFDVLSESAINVEEMENVLYEGHQAACARIRLGATAAEVPLDDIRARSQHILGLELTPLE